VELFIRVFSLESRFSVTKNRKLQLEGRSSVTVNRITNV